MLSRAKKYIEKISHGRSYFDDNSGNNLFLPAKTILASPVKTVFSHCLAKTCKPWPENASHQDEKTAEFTAV